jgi:ACS family tartrate transporter-like MFS transporter
VASLILSGEAAAVGIATINMCAITGGFVGPYWIGWMHDATGGYAVGIGALCVPCLLAAFGMERLLRRREAKQSLDGRGFDD